jgi:hypothetical protein
VQHILDLQGMLTFNKLDEVEIVELFPRGADERGGGE